MTQMDWYPYPDSSGSDIGLCIFLIFSVGGGLPALIWALRFLFLHRGRISVFILLLLVNDLIQLLLNISLAVFLYFNMKFFFQFWSSINLWGFLLHQLVALEGILTLKYPMFSAHIFSLPCYIITTIIVTVFFTLNIFTISMDRIAKVSSLTFCFGTTLATLGLLSVSFIIICKAPPNPAIRNTHLIFTIAMITFVILHFPFIMTSCLDIIMKVHISWTVMSACLMSLRVISDPLLCVLVCRENLTDVETTETQIEANDDQTAEING